jgi:hypothetical protein
MMDQAGQNRQILAGLMASNEWQKVLQGKY